MANLNLTHSGNMNITSASIGSGGTLNVEYEPNDTGKVTGWTITPDSGRTDWESGETITIRFTPQFSGTVLTETFTVSGVDESGVRRSDSSVLRQGFDTNLLHHIPSPMMSLVGVTVNSSAFTENYMEFNVTLQGYGYDGAFCQVLLLGGAGGAYPYALWTGYIQTEPDTGSTAFTFNLVVDDYITGTGIASVTYSPASATTDFHFYAYEDCETETPSSLVTIDEITGEITVLDAGSVCIVAKEQIRGREMGELVQVYVSPEDLIDSIEIIVDSYILNTGNARTVYSPSDANVNLRYSSSDPSIATIDEITGRITVLQNGVVNFTVTDLNSGLSSTKQATVETTGTDSGYTFIVYYNVTSTTESTWIKYTDYTGNYPYSRIIGAKLEDDTTVPLVPDESGNIYFTFPETGITKIIYTSDSNTIPAGAFSQHPSAPHSITQNIVALEAPGIKEIGLEAFFNMEALSSITIPDVTYLGPYCFAGNGFTGDLVLPDGITTLEDSCFEFSYKLQSVTIPSSVTYMGYRVFDYIGPNVSGPDWENYISGADYIRFLGTVPPAGHFSEPASQNFTSATFPIYVPCGSEGAYRAAFPNVAERIVCGDHIVPREDYATYVSLSVSNLILDSGVVSMTYGPTGATVYPVYQSSNPEVVSVDPFTGVLTVNSNGTAVIIGRDVLTNLSSDKTITCVKTIDPSPYTSNYLTFDIITGGTVVLKSGLETGITIDVRVNGGSWQTKKPKSGTTVNLSVSAGDKLEFRATRSRYNHSIFGSSGGCKFNVSGNIFSILTPDPANFSKRKDLPDDYVFRDLFRSCTGIVDASCLVMPSTSMTDSCYERMFQDCTNMTKAPMLPATQAKTTAISPTMANYCYRGMFKGCSNLSYVKCLLTGYYNTSSINEWLSGVATDGIFIKHRNGNASSLQVPSTWTVANAT